MRKFFIKLLVFVVVIAVAYIAGYLPQRQMRKASEQQLQQMREQFDRLQSLVRMARLENQLLTVIEQTGAQNYGTAQELSKQFFDDVREQLNRNSNPAAQPVLQRVLETRDLVTSGLARADASVQDSLKQSLARFHVFLEEQTKT
jgi:hypothetical protein